MAIIAVCGFAGSGKDTVGKYLVENYGFQKDSFASPLKDIVSTIFNWDRYKLEGTTEYNRQWRELPDRWWSEKLNIPDLSPRKALQIIGTDLFRQHFTPDLWMLSLENRYNKDKKNIVVTDARFYNEIGLIKQLGGYVISVERGERPIWWDIAHKVNKTDDESLKLYLTNTERVHPSEYSWIGFDMDATINNNSTLEDLNLKVDHVIKKWIP